MKNTSSTFNKKGNILDILFIIIVVFVLGLAFFFVKFVFSSINTDIQADADIPASSKAIISSGNSSFSSWADYGFAFIFFGLIIGILITSYLIDTHPVFFILSVLAFVFVIFIGANMTNAFEEVVSEDEFLALQSDFPIIMFIMGHLVEFLIVGFASVLIVLYARNPSGGAVR